MLRVGIDDALLDQDHLIYPVCAPFRIIVGLEPVHANHGIVVVGGVREIRFHKRVVIGQFFEPYQRVWASFFHHFRVGSGEHAGKPVHIFPISDVRDLRFVHVEGRDGHPAGDVVPFGHDIVLGIAHGEGTALYQYEVRPGSLALVVQFFEAAPIFVVVVPPCSGGGFLALAGS